MELQTFKKCNDTYVHLLQTCPFSQCKIQIIYKQCYLLTVAYSLPATFMPTATLYKLQGPTTLIFLTKMGYPKSFLHAITYAAIKSDGLGFLHLGHKQGIQKCLQLLKHLQTLTSIGQVIIITLQNYQLLAGIS